LVIQRNIIPLIQQERHILPIASAADLVTSRQETRTGFIEFALEKNRRSTRFIDSARAFRHFALQAQNPADLLNIKDIREPLLAASGLSDKSLAYFTEEDKNIALQKLIKKFLEPAGDEFVDEAVYRYLLMKGDALGGSMRNIVGVMAQQKLIRTLLSVMSVKGLDYNWLSSENKSAWVYKPDDDYAIENTLKAISWNTERGARTLAFNLKIPAVDKNVDLCLFGCGFGKGGMIVNDMDLVIMLGELKGGIDPTGADEHWKTANTALDRIRNAYSEKHIDLLTSFVGAAIEKNMAHEIFLQLRDGTLSRAANLTKYAQLCAYCDWILSL
jgi:type II restriction enzyme